MIDRDKIAYLQELAISHFNDGNIQAALSAWQQVLASDPQNAEALRGIALAQGSAGGEGPFGGGPEVAGDQDADATVMFTVDQMSQLAKPPAPAAPFDPDGTMMFGGPAQAALPAAPAFDPDHTMAFNPGAFPPPAFPPAAAAAPKFDADSTMLFGQPAAGPAPAAPSGGFDADKTMVFGSQPAATPVAPAAPAGGFDAEKTMMFGTPAAAPAAPSFAPPPAAPSFAPPPAAPSFGAPPAAPSFGPPPAAPSFGPPPAAPSFGAPPAPGGGGFSFELPPPPAAKPGSAFGLPEIPSLGPAPTFTPAPPLAPPPPAAPKKSGAQFGEVDAGDADALAAPTIGLGGPAKAEAPVGDAKEREEELKRRYENEFGRSTPTGTPSYGSQPIVRQAPKSKLPLYLFLVFAVLMGGAWVVIKYWPGTDTGGGGPTGPTGPKVVPLTQEQAEQKIIEILSRVPALLAAGDLAGADKLIAEARDLALKVGIPVPPALDKTVGEVEFEKQYRSKFQKALRHFCVEDYSTANILFAELEQAKPADPEPGRYIERIYYNLGISELQKKQPWEAVFYFENLLSRNAADAEVKSLASFSTQWPVGSDLGYQYTKRVDPLTDRTSGCR